MQIPEFDNFYLDMNGIIHACSHPNDDDPTFSISEDKIFNDIFRYIEVSHVTLLSIVHLVYSVTCRPYTGPVFQVCTFENQGQLDGDKVKFSH